MLCLVFNLEAGCQSYTENLFQQNISVWGINISLRVIEVHEKKVFYSAIF
jgi:hypothetical protein